MLLEVYISSISVQFYENDHWSGVHIDGIIDTDRYLVFSCITLDVVEIYDINGTRLHRFNIL